VKSYDEIKALLGVALIDAVKIHEREELNPHDIGAAVAKALERYNRFTLHGMIPDDLREDDAVKQPSP